jgi:hypothetical protein
MPEDFWRWTFHLRRRSQLTITQNALTEVDILFTEVVKIARLIKLIYEPLKMRPFLEAGLLRGPSPLIGRGPKKSQPIPCYQVHIYTGTRVFSSTLSHPSLSRLSLTRRWRLSHPHLSHAPLSISPLLTTEGGTP